MPIIVQCPNPACGVTSLAADAVNGRNVRCKKCGTPFVAKPTLDGVIADTKKHPPSSNTNPFPVLPGEFGRYRILRLLGRGGMGAVYLAEDSTLGRQVALKIPFFDASESPQRVERFVREARSAAALHHPNICTVYDAGEIDSRPFITMAYIAGKPLEDEIDPDAPMPQARAAEIARKIALALDHAHVKGTVHRDLKPANVMMAADGEPVVMDFGLAKRLVDGDAKENKLTRDGGLLGTPSYMAPEQVRGESAAIGPATDVYALGVMLFEMLTGNTPYRGPLGVVMLQIQTAPVPPVSEFRRDVDSWLNAVCRKAMAKEPADRYVSMAEFAEALSLYLKAPLAVVPHLRVPMATPVAPAPYSSWLNNLADAIPPAPALEKAKEGSVAAGVPSAKQTVIVSGATALAAAVSLDTPIPHRTPRLRKKWPLLAGIAAGLLLAGLAVPWASGVFRLKTADGILVVQVNEPNAEVFVDGDRMTVSWNDGGKTAEIHVKPGTRKVEVKKDGFSVDGKELTFKDGDRAVFTARLLPEQAAKADASKSNAPPVAGKELPAAAAGHTRFPIPADVEQPVYGAWQVKDNELVQPHWVWGARLLFGEKTWTDYDFTVEGQMTDRNCGFGVTVRNSGGKLAVNPQDGTSRNKDLLIFLVGGYGNTHHYLEQVRGTRSETLSITRLEPAQRLQTGQWYAARVSVRGDHIRCYLNNDKLFDVFAKPPPAGLVGLMTWDAPFRFRNIKVTDPSGKVLLEGLPDLEK